MAEVDAAKAELRRRMRSVRLELVDRADGRLDERSKRIVGRLVALAPLVRARVVAGYRSVSGEVDTTSLAAWCREMGVGYVAPDPVPGASVPAGLVHADVLVVPGLAFDRRGGRLGQGGGWYDRVLAGQRPDLVVGLAFAEQVVDHVPTADHDAGVDCVVDDDGAWWAP